MTRRTSEQLVRAVLASSEWTERVVVAAVAANVALERVRLGQSPDGDGPSLAPATLLRTALSDLDALARRLEES